MSWPLVKIEDVFDVARGGSPRPIDNFITDDPDGVNWIMIGDTKNGGKYIDSTAKKIRVEGVKKSREVKEGDFLLTNSMSFGRPYILKTSGCVHDGWLVLSPRSDQISTDYFYYFLGSQEIKNKLVSKAAGAVVKNLNKDIVKGLEIPLPPLAEQKRIAAILDKADAIRRKRQQAIRLADEFLRSVFLDMFGDPVTNPKGWELCSMRELIHIQGGYAFKSTEFVESGIPVVKIGNANKLGFTAKEIDFIRPDNLKKLEQYELYPGDLLMSLTGTVGKDDYANVTEVSSEYGKYYLNQRVAKITVNLDRITKSYLKFLLAHPRIKAEITKNNRGVRQANISNGDIYGLVVPVPNKSILSLFDQVISKSDVLIERMSTGPLVIKELTNSLSQKAFSGQL